MMPPNDSHTIDRRRFLALGGATAASLAVGASVQAAESTPAPLGRAEHCIVLWLGGGACQIDTFDPKKRGDAKARKPGSYYDPVSTAIEGVQVCEHLPRTAALLDRAVLLRTVHHGVVDEHAAAVNRMHTGRPTSGTIVYPSMGSVVSKERGAAHDGVPPYIVMGYPNLTRGPGFLGAKHGYVYLTDTETGPAGLTRPGGLSDARATRREKLVAKLRKAASAPGVRSAGDPVDNYAQVAEQAFRLAGPEFMSAFDMDRESADLRNSYGSEFGQRCLLARRLIERGVRFVEVSHNLNFINGTGWDTHNDGQLKQHELIRELDSAFSSLLIDLERKKLLDKTMIMISTEFGRPAGFDGGGGRGHQSTAFSVVLAGGGLRTGRVIGETDETGENAVSGRVSVPDLFATTYAALGIDPRKELYAGERPVPITDGGRPLKSLLH